MFSSTNDSARVQGLPKASWLFMLLIGLVALPVGLAMGPPRPGELGRYRADGTLARRQAFAEKTANYRLNPDLARRKLAQIRAQQASGTGRVDMAIFPYATGLPAKGSPRIFALLIDFAEYPHTIPESSFTQKIFGTGKSEEKPYESLTEYYKRSSYGALNIQGEVLPWYRAKKARNEYGDAETLVKEALDEQTKTRDFTVYDNNGDGKIDYFVVFYTGPDTGWGSLWWGWCGGFLDSETYRLDGKKLGTYSFQWEANPVGSEFTPHIVIHETGHGLGLPDLYDYDDKVGAKGACGGLDIMDANWGDHNAFSKWLLDWIQPTIISAKGPIQSIRLRPSALYKDAVLIMPGTSLSDPFSEFYIVQNRSRREKGDQAGQQTSNDSDYPSDGILIWHVDARLNDTNSDWAWNNSYTDHKLMRLMEADGRESISSGYCADAGDYFTPSQYFSDVTSPNSKDYGNLRTGINVFNIYPVTGTLLNPQPPSTFNVDFQISSSNIIGLGEAVDHTGLTWASGGSTYGLGFYGQSATSFFGGDAARSTKPGDGKYSYMSTTVTGPATLKFYWRVSSEWNGDYLEFYLDSTLQDKISGEAAWGQKSVAIPAGTHKLAWYYRKNATGAAGGDCGWVDKIEYGPVSLEEALDNPGLTLATSGANSWSGQGVEYFYGGSSAQSGAVSHNQYSKLSTLVSGPGTLRFYWKVSSEAGSDFLQLLVDDAKNSEISGEADWQVRSIAVGAGAHTITWQYLKNGSVSQGADRGWVDKLVYFDGAGGASLADGVDNYTLSWSDSVETPWTYCTSTWRSARGNNDSVQCALAGGKKAALLATVTGPGTLSFWWKESAATTSADLEFLIDSSYQGYCNSSDWTQKTIAVPAGMHTLKWSYDNYGSKNDTGWVDQVVYTPEIVNLGEALDNTTLPITTYGATAGWSPVYDSGAAGLDSARTGAVGQDQYSFLETTVRGPGQLLFNWKVSSETGHGFLNFTLDNVNKGTISGSVGWQPMAFILTPGDHPLSWFYFKDNTNSVGSDAGWVDRVRVVPLTPLGEALDNKTLGFNTYASSSGGEWVGQTQSAWFGGAAAQSGPLGNKQNARLVTEVTGPGTLTFTWKVACHDFWNYMSISVGSQVRQSGSDQFITNWKEKARISGQKDWQTLTVSIDKGTHPVMWQYIKSGSFGDDGPDCGWVDKVEYVQQAATEEPWRLYE